VQPPSKIDWSLLWSAVKDHTTFFFILLVMGLVFGLVGGVILYNGFGELGAMFIGGLFALIGLAMFIAAFVTTYSSISYYYDLALLRKHGMNVDAVLTKKEAQCQFHQEYDHNNNPLGEGYHLCDLLVEFDFQFDGRNYAGAYYLGKAELFDKLREGDPLPLRVLRLDPTVHKVRERRLANMLKDRATEGSSAIPEGAEISQLV
jgi:hypothetical protein